MNKQWEKIQGRNNEVLNANWGYISYNPDTTESHYLAGIGTDLLNMLGEDVADGEETALYIRKDNSWRILTGDFRKQYEKVFPVQEKCLAVYNKYKQTHRNNYSTKQL